MKRQGNGERERGEEKGEADVKENGEEEEYKE
jgi:hypothetical protein